MFLNFDTKTMKEMRGHWVQFVNMSQVVCKQSDYGDIGCILSTCHKWFASSLTKETSFFIFRLLGRLVTETNGRISMARSPRRPERHASINSDGGPD